jgi:hypothetical protein
MLIIPWYWHECVRPRPDLPSQRDLGPWRCYLPQAFTHCHSLRVRSRGRGPAKPMGFPPPLVPHINCEPRRPLPTLDTVLGADRSLLRRLLARRRSYAAHRSPEGEPYGIFRASVLWGGPSRHLLITISWTMHFAYFVTFGELSAPLIRSGPPCGDSSCLPEGTTLGPLIQIRLSLTLPVRAFRELSAPLVNQVSDPRATHPCSPFGDIIPFFFWTARFAYKVYYGKP